MLIYEILSSPREFEYHSFDNDGASAVFEIEGRRYVVNIERLTLHPDEARHSPALREVLDHADHYYEIDFSIPREYWGADRFNPTGTGNQFKVFSTVIEILKDFVSEIRPKVIGFSGKMSIPSQIKLYDRLANLVASATGGRVVSAIIDENRRNKNWFILI